MLFLLDFAVGDFSRRASYYLTKFFESDAENCFVLESIWIKRRARVPLLVNVHNFESSSLGNLRKHKADRETAKEREELFMIFDF